jgi:hypothetical protein
MLLDTCCRTPTIEPAKVTPAGLQPAGVDSIPQTLSSEWQRISHSTVSARPKKGRPSRPEKPSKPHAEFPLFPSDCGRWRKKVKGVVYYFGRWADDRKGDRAIKLWNESKDEILAGNPP